MTGDDIPANPSVLNTTVLSNFDYIGQLWVVADLFGICTVPVVREDLEHDVATIRIFSRHSIHLTTRFKSRRFRTSSQTERRLSVTIPIPVKHRRLH
jgi:hypothetical protein